ncbi:unnamed protein product [Strongylus vulgaris]|uniref:Uncharacterized protein n=1 Tax=Strongylus vulgaris TaxID=40348 RepID=A0A3P7HW48_STRVU|nr:unnamed protein product [Strongylus vulgaris]
MFRVESKLSEDHALNGLSQLSKLVKGLLGKEFKKNAEREAAKKDVATIVSNCLHFYISGSTTDIYPLNVLVKDLCSLALLEVEENNQKMKKKASSWKTGSLELTLNVLNKVCGEGILDGDLNDFLKFFITVIEAPFVQSQKWIEDDLTSTLLKFMSATSLTATGPSRELWLFIWHRLPLVLDTTTKSFGNYLRVARYVLKDISKTTMVSGENGSNLIADMVR